MQSVREEPHPGALREDMGNNPDHEGVIPNETLERNEQPFCPNCMIGKVNTGDNGVLKRRYRAAKP